VLFIGVLLGVHTAIGVVNRSLRAASISARNRTRWAERLVSLCAFKACQINTRSFLESHETLIAGDRIVSASDSTSPLFNANGNVCGRWPNSTRRRSARSRRNLAEFLVRSQNWRADHLRVMAASRYARAKTMHGFSSARSGVLEHRQPRLRAFR